MSKDTCHAVITMVAIKTALAKYPNYTQMIEDIETEMDKRFIETVSKKVEGQFKRSNFNFYLDDSGWKRKEPAKYKELLDLVIRHKNRLCKILHVPNRFSMDECIDEVEERVKRFSNE